MACKKLTVPTLTGSPVSVHWDRDLGEYQVRVKGNKAATYYTDDQGDALATAQHMRNNLSIEGGRFVPAPR